MRTFLCTDSLRTNLKTWQASRPCLEAFLVWARPLKRKCGGNLAKNALQGRVCQPRRFRVLWRTCIPGCVLQNGPGPPGRHSAAGLEQPQQMFGLAARVCARLGLGTTCRTRFCGERRANASIGTLNCFGFPRLHCPSSIGNGPALAIRGPKAVRKQPPVPGMSRSVGHLHFPEVQVSKTYERADPIHSDTAGSQLGTPHIGKLFVHRGIARAPKFCLVHPILVPVQDGFSPRRSRIRSHDAFLGLSLDQSIDPAVFQYGRHVSRLRCNCPVSLLWKHNLPPHFR